MKIFTTFCPRKIVWELTYAISDGKNAASNWLDYLPMIKKSLIILKRYGIVGIRLAIFSFELTKDGYNFDFKPIDVILKYCEELNISIQLCLGPYQYPYYPGVRLPAELLTKINKAHVTLDKDKQIKKFGINFLNKQLERYGSSKNIEGFYLANEWPDKQKIEDKEDTIAFISEEFMIEATNLVKNKTKKPIYFNTNIDAFSWKKINSTFKNIFKILKSQYNLGLDLYPSRQDMKRKMLFSLVSYKNMIGRISELFSGSVVISELEAQPWGNGKTWYEYIKKEKSPLEKVLDYNTNNLQDTWNKYIINSGVKQVSLWGADFWLVCHALRINWPLDRIKQLSLKNYSQSKLARKKAESKPLWL